MYAVLVHVGHACTLAQLQNKNYTYQANKPLAAVKTSAVCPLRTAPCTPGDSGVAFLPFASISLADDNVS